MPDEPDLDAAALEVLRQRMADTGVSGVRLAAASGISEPTLHRKLSKGGTFTLAEWERLTAVLQVHLEDFVEEARQRLRHLGD